LVAQIRAAPSSGWATVGGAHYSAVRGCYAVLVRHGRSGQEVWLDGRADWDALLARGKVDR
jgi:hypothetical protein